MNPPRDGSIKALFRFAVQRSRCVGVSLVFFCIRFCLRSFGFKLELSSSSSFSRRYTCCVDFHIRFPSAVFKRGAWLYLGAFKCSVSKPAGSCDIRYLRLYERIYVLYKSM